MPILSLFPSLFDLFLAITLGAGLGFLGGLFGIGGGIVAVPLFVLGFHMDQPLAQGTALVLMVPNLLIGWWRYSQRHPVPWRAALAIGLPATLTTWGIAHVATSWLNPTVMRLLFSLCIALLALQMLLPRRQRREGGASLRLRTLPFVGVAGGSSMGLLGIGGGLVATPLLSGWLGLRQTLAQSLSLALVAPSSAVALITYAGAGQVDWHLGLPMAIGGMLTVSAGVALAHRLPERRMRLAFAWMLVATAVWLTVGPALR